MMLQNINIAIKSEIIHSSAQSQLGNLTVNWNPDINRSIVLNFIS